MKSKPVDKAEIREAIRHNIGNHLEVCYAVVEVLADELPIDNLIQEYLEPGDYFSTIQSKKQWDRLVKFFMAIRDSRK